MPVHHSTIFWNRSNIYNIYALVDIENDDDHEKKFLLWYATIEFTAIATPLSLVTHNHRSNNHVRFGDADDARWRKKSRYRRDDEYEYEEQKHLQYHRSESKSTGVEAWYGLHPIGGYGI